MYLLLLVILPTSVCEGRDYPWNATTDWPIAQTFMQNDYYHWNRFHDGIDFPPRNDLAYRTLYLLQRATLVYVWAQNEDPYDWVLFFHDNSLNKYIVYMHLYRSQSLIHIAGHCSVIDVSMNDTEINAALYNAGGCEFLSDTPVGVGFGDTNFHFGVLNSANYNDATISYNPLTRFTGKLKPADFCSAGYPFEQVLNCPPDDTQAGWLWPTRLELWKQVNRDINTYADYAIASNEYYYVAPKKVQCVDHGCSGTQWGIYIAKNDFSVSSASHEWVDVYEYYTGYDRNVFLRTPICREGRRELEYYMNSYCPNQDGYDSCIFTGVDRYIDEMEAAAVGVYNTIEFYAAEFDVGTRFTLERSQDGGVSWETVLGSNVSYTVPQYYTVFDYSPTYSQYYSYRVRDDEAGEGPDPYWGVVTCKNLLLPTPPPPSGSIEPEIHMCLGDGCVVSLPQAGVANVNNYIIKLYSDLGDLLGQEYWPQYYDGYSGDPFIEFSGLLPTDNYYVTVSAVSESYPPIVSSHADFNPVEPIQIYMVAGYQNGAIVHLVAPLGPGVGGYGIDYCETSQSNWSYKLGDVSYSFLRFENLVPATSYSFVPKVLDRHGNNGYNGLMQTTFTAGYPIAVDESQEEGFSASLYPNPSRGSLTKLIITNTLKGQPISSEVSAYDISGRQVWRRELSVVEKSRSSVSIPLFESSRNIPAGVYFIKVSTRQETGEYKDTVTKIVWLK